METEQDNNEVKLDCESRFVLYDYDLQELVITNTYSSYEEAEADLDDRLDNIVIVELKI